MGSALGRSQATPVRARPLTTPPVGGWQTWAWVCGRLEATLQARWLPGAGAHPEPALPACVLCAPCEGRSLGGGAGPTTLQWPVHAARSLTVYRTRRPPQGRVSSLAPSPVAGSDSLSLSLSNVSGMGAGPACGALGCLGPWRAFGVCRMTKGARDKAVGCETCPSPTTRWRVAFPCLPPSAAELLVRGP